MVDVVSAMRMALEEAGHAASLGEVPVGAVMLFNGSVIARAGNRRETSSDPLGHAELLVIREAAIKLETWKLVECMLVVTLEPCIMCAGAILNARIGGVVFGAFDPLGGACGSRYNVLVDPRVNHNSIIEGGLCDIECAALLREFFDRLR